MIKIRKSFLGLAFFAGISLFGQGKESLTDFVNPFIGSQGNGNTFVGTSTPFAMIKPSPDVGKNDSNSGWKPNGNINGFSQTHVSGTGGGAKYGNILIMPVNGELNLADISSERENESAKLSLYSVDLKKYAIKVEITSASRAAIYRISFPKKEGAKIVFDAGHLLYNNIAGEGQHLVNSEFNVISNREVCGQTSVIGGWNLQKTPYTVYFYAVSDQAANSFGVFSGNEILAGKKSVKADGEVRAGGFLEFAPERQVHLKIGISFKSVKQAKIHANQIKNFDFENTYQKAIAQWQEALGKVQIKGTSKDKKQLFYTTIYHTMLMPVDRTNDNPLWQSKEPYYDDFYAIWDTFRTSAPLLNLIAPKRQEAIIRALIDIQKNEGFLPDGRSGNYNGRTQGGSNADVYIADAFVKGILKGATLTQAYNAAKVDAEVEPADGYKEGRGGLKSWNELGYLPIEAFKMSGCKNVEYAYNDFCLMQMALSLNENADAKRYAIRASQWQNVWNDELEDGNFKGFIHPKHKNGQWLKNFNPMQGCSWRGDTFYEGNSWTYSFYVPQDMASLIKKCGGAQKFIDRLDEFFDGKAANGANRCDISNEPFFLTPYLYIFVNRHDKTAQRVRKVMSRFWAGANGLPGNDDSGALGAWFTFSSMGIFPVAGQDYYLIGSPLFEQTTIEVGKNKKFTIEAENLSDKNIYVSDIILNGKPLNQAWIKHSQILEGGKLVLKMSDKPDNAFLKTPPPSPLSELN